MWLGVYRCFMINIHPWKTQRFWINCFLRRDNTNTHRPNSSFSHVCLRKRRAITAAAVAFCVIASATYFVIPLWVLRYRESVYGKDNESLGVFKSPYNLIVCNTSDQDYGVTRIVHYVSLTARLSLYECLSMKSARAFANPDMLYVHRDGVTPSGVW